MASWAGVRVQLVDAVVSVLLDERPPRGVERLRSEERWQVELAHLRAGDRELPRRELLLVHLAVAHEVVKEVVGDRLPGGVRARAHAATIPCFFDAQMHNLNSENLL